MIFVRSPLRITFGGGGTDLPSYSSRYGGFCISCAITKYAYVGINRAFTEGITLRYSETEKTGRVNWINHPIFREALRWANFKTPQLEVFSVADVPSQGAGLGNSGAFTVALLKALVSYKNLSFSNSNIADLACTINMGILGKLQGKQDEYASAIGGVTCFEFLENGKVRHYPLEMKYDVMKELEENLLLFYTNKSHNTEEILKYQDNKTKENEKEIIDNLNKTKEVGYWAKKYLEEGKLKAFGELLSTQWHLKEDRMPSHDYRLLELYSGFLQNGAVGAKLVGSGMGGFFLVYSEDKEKTRYYANHNRLGELRFQFDFEGCKRMI